MRAIQNLMSIKKQFMIIYLHAMLQFPHPKQQKTCKTASTTKHAFVILCYTRNMSVSGTCKWNIRVNRKLWINDGLEEYMVQSRSYWEKMSGVDDEKKKKKLYIIKTGVLGGNTSVHTQKQPLRNFDFFVLTVCCFRQIRQINKK